MPTPADGATIQFDGTIHERVLHWKMRLLSQIIITVLKEMTRIQCSEWFEINTIDC